MSLSSRRVFIVRLVSASAAMAAGGVLSACGGGGDGGDGGGNPPAATPVRFDYGVASGDPLADRVVLWTHATGGADPAVVALNWEVALDAGFTQVVSSGQTQAAADAAIAICDPAEDLRGDAEYKTAMAGEMVKRALAKAWARCA